MANPTDKYPDNAPGKYYVDTQCIDCDLCRETAPANFKRNEEGGYSFVYKQPQTPTEEELCRDAMAGCPVEAIGSDGNSLEAGYLPAQSPRPYGDRPPTPTVN